MTNYLPNWLSLKIGQTLKKVNEGQLLSMICIIVSNLYCLWFMGNGKGHVCSFIIEVSSRGAACVQCTECSQCPADLRHHRCPSVWIKIQPLFFSNSELRKSWPGAKLGDGKLLLWVCRKCKERKEKDEMKIHPLKMDPDERKPPCSGQYHQGHLPTSWIIYIPDCPGPMVIQNIQLLSGGNFYPLVTLSFILVSVC